VAAEDKEAVAAKGAAVVDKGAAADWAALASAEVEGQAVPVEAPVARGAAAVAEVRAALAALALASAVLAAVVETDLVSAAALEEAAVLDSAAQLGRVAAEVAEEAAVKDRRAGNSQRSQLSPAEAKSVSRGRQPTVGRPTIRVPRASCPCGSGYPFTMQVAPQGSFDKT
jgi:hypothetical protein